jgi:dephospho-CoA kinase
MDSPLRIGLTGGIASGKSTVADAFAARGVPVIDADRLAREVVGPGQPALAAIIAAFGAEYLLPDRTLDRRRLRELVFADAGRRRQLEAIVHPAVRAAEVAELGRIKAPYVVVSIPLLAETGQRHRFDRVLVVDCPEEVQKSRLMARDGASAAQAEAMLAAQATRAERLAIADEVLDNSGSRAALEAAVEQLHRQYLALAAGGGGRAA